MMLKLVSEYYKTAVCFYNIIIFILVSGNHLLPKGTTCYIAPLFTHRDCDSYPNPLNFNPENFSQENISKRHKYSFIAFSGGPRRCIGNIIF